MIYQNEEEHEPKELIDYIKGLRESTKDKDTCLTEYLKYSALLIKAPLALLLIQTETKDWNLLNSYGISAFERNKDKLVSLALSMNNRVRKKGFAYERVDIEGLAFSNQIAFAIKIDKKIKEEEAFLYFIIEYQNGKHLSEMIIRTLMNSDIPSLLYGDNQFIEQIEHQSISKDKMQSLSVDVLEILSKIIFQEKFLLASMFLVNEVATRFNCSQVSFGWEKGSYINPIAISHIEKFDKNMESIRSLEALYEESADQNEEILYPLQELGDTIVFAHHHYVDKTKATEVISLPFRLDGRVVGVMSCEKINGSFSDEELMLLRLLSNYITPWLKEVHDKDRWFTTRLLLNTRNSLAKFFTLKHTFLKFSVIVLSAFIIYASLSTWNFKVEVVASLETDNIAFISAPFNGLVYSVNVHAGDKVKKGDNLLSFDKDELYLKELEALADINKYKSESKKARAKKSLADMRVALLKEKEAKLSLKRVEYYLKKSDIITPLTGVIITGDKEELLGAPVEKGELLFKVAQSTDLYLKLKIPESSIDELNTSLGGEFALLSSPDKKYHFIIENIIPIAEVDNSEGNVFIAQAKVVDVPEGWWRAGMSGVAKIEVGKRNILWILTHDSIEFLRMYFWI